MKIPSLICFLSDIQPDELVVAVDPQEDAIVARPELLHHVTREHALKTLDALKTDALLHHVHVGLVVPPAHNYKFRLLALGILWPGKL